MITSFFFVSLLFKLPFFLPSTSYAFNFADLKSLIEQKQITSTETLLPLLPEVYRSKYTLMFNSRSLQGSSFENPRALLFGDTARFILSFNGDPLQKGFQALETAEFDSQKNKFFYREILFLKNSENKIQVTYSEPNPEKCLKCHSSTVRPIWDSFPTWPGAYGQRYHAPLTLDEQNGIAHFLANQPTHPRYQYLLHSEIYADKETFNPSHENRYHGRQKLSPNESFSRLINELNYRRIVQLLRESPLFKSYLYALLASVNSDCGELGLYLRPEMRKHWEEKYKDFALLTEKRNEEQEKLKTIRADAHGHSTPSEKIPEKITLTPLRFLAEQGLSLSTKNWTTALETDTYDFTDAGAVQGKIEKLLLGSLTDEDADIEKAAHLNSVNNSETYCKLLKKKSLAALAPLSSASFKAETVAAASETPLHLLNTCISCHDGNVGPAIPFQRPERLTLALKQKNYPRGSLIKEILFRLSPEAGAERMPRGMNLSENDRETLENYFKKIDLP